MIAMKTENQGNPAGRLQSYASKIGISQVMRFILAVMLVVNGFESAAANDLVVNVTDKKGSPMSDVVVYAHPEHGALPNPGQLPRAVISQGDMQFSPYVTAVQVGSQVEFPNYDKMEHHVKSFSAPKEFEIKTYEKGVTPPPVTFDKPGVVIIYCLLHNWMRAYLLVLDTSYFSKTDTGGVTRLAKLPPGEYKIEAWHPNLGAIKAPLVQHVKITGSDQNLQFQFDFVPIPRRNK